MELNQMTSHIHNPTRVYLKESERKTPYGHVLSSKVTLEPLERGYGHTLGNTLRRVLLSSIPGCSVCGVDIDGISHELETINGVKEDVLAILLNLKHLAVCLPEEKDFAILELEVKGQKVVTAEDIKSFEVEITNPKLLIAHLNAEASLSMRLYIKRGFGYVSSENQEYNIFGEAIPATFLRMDSVYSPVVNVAYQVQGTRVKQRTDYDRLVMSIETNGVVSPDEALKVATSIISRQMKIFGELGDHLNEEVNPALDKSEDRHYKRKISELDLGVRALNCLQNMNIETIGELISYSEKELLRTPNLGRKSLEEIKVLLSERALSLRLD